MKITFPNGLTTVKRFFSSNCTGYAASAIEIDADDVYRMREMALHAPKEFQQAMAQLEARFPCRRALNAVSTVIAEQEKAPPRDDDSENVTPTMLRRWVDDGAKAHREDPAHLSTGGMTPVQRAAHVTGWQLGLCLRKLKKARDAAKKMNRITAAR